MAMKETVVPGENKADIFLFTLSTCVWCKKTKQFLKDLGVRYQYVNVDELEGEERKEALDRLQKWNPRPSYPTIVINNSQCIVGFKEKEIKEALQ